MLHGDHSKTGERPVAKSRRGDVPRTVARRKVLNAAVAYSALVQGVTGPPVSRYILSIQEASG